MIFETNARKSPLFSRPRFRSIETLSTLWLACIVALPGVGHAGHGAAQAESMARARYFEGVPYAEARAVDPDGIQRLVELLEDPGEAAHHATIIEILGITGQATAYDAIERYAATVPVGNVDGAVYRARLSIPIAMGHLAREDDRALSYLVARTLRSDAEGWRYRHLDGAAAGKITRELAIAGLGLSGRPEAGAALRSLRPSRGTGTTRSVARRAPDDAQLRAHIEDALALQARIAAEGASAVLGDAPEGAQ